MPLPEFTTEAEFREQWIGPLLTRLSFIHVVHTHGEGEQGKDFIFADFDRFEHLRFYAVQAKLGDIGAGDVELQKLLGQVERSFRVRIRDRKGAEDRRVSAVYVMASGRISARAREYISEHCRSAIYGENVYFLDGDRLDQINRSVQHRSDAETRSKLLALGAELFSNRMTLNALTAAYSTDRDAFGPLRVSSLERFLSSPNPTSQALFRAVESLWRTIEIIRPFINANVSLRRPEGAEKRRKSVIVTEAAIKQCDELERLLKLELAALDARYDLRIETFGPELPTSPPTVAPD